MNALSSAWHRFLFTLGTGILIAFIATMILLPHRAVSDSTAGPLTGWLWSDTIGWISLNCADVNPSCTVNYKVSVDASGNLSGYGWSENVGWVSFNAAQLSGCPQTQTGNTTCAPTITNGTFQGWARVCGGMDDSALNQTTSNNTCGNGAGTRTDGWDGWISVYGLSPYPYGGSVGSSGSVTGYAWGSDVVGWTSFQANSTYRCSPQASYCQNSTTLCTYDVNSCSFSCTACAWQCGGSPGACLSPTPICSITSNPEIVASGATTTVSWSSTNAISCTVSGNGNSWSGTSGSQVSNAINGTATYTETCTGPDSVSKCSTTATIGPSPQFQER